ncbi:protein tyrosine phosphatase [Arthrobacter sp. NQ7]|uniref:protein tyrosine phosphatase n=1 Tax=Arthrobacter sp. NQ7 TaxID=3032303 RepID=UPI00240EDBE4|nr:protein tyrosine phosphatase [Arthrobacter sp. NQ7]MDJ0457031.1 protein tyrosine phosphatase [Arthrobacter sp. NQ7]
MSFFTALVSSKIAAGALAAGTLAVGGTAAAAYTGTLPAPLQENAHTLIGAPAPAASTALATQATTTTTTAETTASATADATETATASETPSATPTAVDATGPAAYGLCQAFTNGGLDTSSIAYKSLTVAASGASNIATYCAAVASPGESASNIPAETGADAAIAHIPAQAVAPAAPQLPAQAVAPAAPELPTQAVVPAAPQQAATGTAHQPSTAGRP